MKHNKYDCIGYYNDIKHNILSYMKENNINEMDIWCCKFELNLDGFFESSLFPNKYRIEIQEQNMLSKNFYYKINNTLKIFKIESDGYLGYDYESLISKTGIINSKGAYICFNEKESINEFNNQVYNSIKFIEKEINKLKNKQNILQVKKNMMENNFINSDYIAEKLSRGE